MRNIMFVVLSLVLFCKPTFASELQAFLKSCAYGTLGGAVAGVASLALTDKPSDHVGNVARGASLGLYAGIGYGIYQMNKGAGAAAEDLQTTSMAIIPLGHSRQRQVSQGQATQVDGAALVFTSLF